MDVDQTGQLAPITLLVQRRPQHTLKTLRALQSNPLAKRSTLFVYADNLPAQATGADREDLHEVRRIVLSQPWAGRVVPRFSDRHLGLADNAVGALTATLARYDRAIYLEDDTAPAPGFLSYMNDALHTYAACPTVMHVNGHMLPVREMLPETFFTRWMSPWGFGTWRRAWAHLSLDSAALIRELLARGAAFGFDADGTFNHMQHLQKNADGLMHSWAAKWHASIYLNGGLCLTPGGSLTHNHGLDGTGTFTEFNTAEDGAPLRDRVEVTPQPPRECMASRVALVRWVFVHRNGWRGRKALELLRHDRVELLRRSARYTRYRLQTLGLVPPPAANAPRRRRGAAPGQPGL